ncbi:hypothetical protein [Motilibacter peucedani]|uniref:hypothetical protein n=1 Tax=Motilibacter peucedani TaxID=598650 RepID=UPI000EAF692A|nr:hypothetical protein [Motilibacter peucedani]
MDPELEAALTVLLRDLSAPGGVVPDVRDVPWQPYPGTASCMLHAADGSGMGVFIELGRPTAEQVAHLADQVQEWAVEALWTLSASTSWPPCPHHPGSHPLQAEEHDGRAVWCCPVDRHVVTEVGRLGVQDASS